MSFHLEHHHGPSPIGNAVVKMHRSVAPRARHKCYRRSRERFLANSHAAKRSEPAVHEASMPRVQLFCAREVIRHGMRRRLNSLSFFWMSYT